MNISDITFDKSFKGNPDIARMLLLYIHRVAGNEYTSINAKKLFNIAHNRYVEYIEYFIKMNWIEVYHGYEVGVASKQYKSLLAGNVAPWEPYTKTGHNKVQSLSSIIDSPHKHTQTLSGSYGELGGIGGEYIPYDYGFFQYEKDTVMRVYFSKKGYEILLSGKVDVLDMGTPRFQTEYINNHGRVYHHLQGKKDLRQHFLLDNEKVTEVDISCSHPWIAGHLVDYPIDPSTFYIELAGMLSNILQTEVTRDDAKKANMQLLNAHHTHPLYRTVYKELDEYSVGRFYKKVRKISKNHKGEGSRFEVLAKKEAELMNNARQILFRKQVPFFTIHDSIAVSESNRAFAKDALHEASEIVFGSNHNILVK